jgi:hypothetical protein
MYKLNSGTPPTSRYCVAVAPSPARVVAVHVYAPASSRRTVSIIRYAPSCRLSLGNGRPSSRAHSTRRPRSTGHLRMARELTAAGAPSARPMNGIVQSTHICCLNHAPDFSLVMLSNQPTPNRSHHHKTHKDLFTMDTNTNMNEFPTSTHTPKHHTHMNITVGNEMHDDNLQTSVTTGNMYAPILSVFRVWPTMRG